MDIFNEISFSSSISNMISQWREYESKLQKICVTIIICDNMWSVGYLFSFSTVYVFHAPRIKFEQRGKVVENFPEGRSGPAVQQPLKDLSWSSRAVSDDGENFGAGPVQSIGRSQNRGVGSLSFLSFQWNHRNDVIHKFFCRFPFWIESLIDVIQRSEGVGTATDIISSFLEIEKSILIIFDHL